MKKSPARSWAVFLIVAVAAVAFTNPWAQEWLMELHIQTAWLSQETGTGIGIKAASELLSAAMFLMLTIAGPVYISCGLTMAHMAQEAKKKSGLGGKYWPLPGKAVAWILAGTVLTIFLGVYISKSLTNHLAATLIQETVKAEQYQGFEPAIRGDLVRLTRDYKTIAANKEFFEALKGTTHAPDRLMTVLPAVDVLGREHPSVAFALDNGLLRTGDMQAIQKDLFLRVREGDPNARAALAAIMGPSLEGEMPSL